MDLANPNLSDQQSGNEPKRRLELAIAYGGSLKREFHTSLRRRDNPEPWERLGKAIAVLLEQTRKDSHDLDWFSRTDSRFIASVTDWMARSAPNATRGRYYRRAALEVFHSAEFSQGGLDQPMVAYWRHAALIWISLWHLADIPQLTAENAKNCLDFALKQEAEPAPNRGDRRSIAGIFRKGA